MRLRPRLHMFPWRSFVETNCNTYVLGEGETLLLDPGHMRHTGALFRRMEEAGLHPADVRLAVATHPHPDHHEGLAAFGGETRTAMHRDAPGFLRDFARVWKRFTGRVLVEARVDERLSEGPLDAAGERLRVVETPGHSPGSVCLFREEDGVLFSGDVVFSGNCGRVDLPGGDGAAQLLSLARLEALDADLLLPGHGPIVSGREAVRKNFRAVREFAEGML